MPDHDNPLPWTQPNWFEQASTWIHRQLEAQGWHAIGSIEILHMRPWSAFARVPTMQGTVYFKAPSPPLRFEAALTDMLRQWRPDCIVPLLAIDKERGWMLSSDAGVTLRTR